jgi:large subunit ribosomal protein L17
MRHQNANRKFGLKTQQRTALMRSLANSLILKGKITTTEPKAKEIRPYTEKLVTTGRAGTLAARRLLASRMGDPKAVKQLMDVVAPKYKARAGGYTRITKLAHRQGDGSSMATIEFV